MAMAGHQLFLLEVEHLVSFWPTNNFTCYNVEERWPDIIFTDFKRSDLKMIQGKLPKGLKKGQRVLKCEVLVVFPQRILLRKEGGLHQSGNSCTLCLLMGSNCGPR